MSSFVLKLLAMVSMAIDHTGALLFPGNEVLRLIGRIAFPIYCLLSLYLVLVSVNIYEFLAFIPFMDCVRQPIKRSCLELGPNC